MKKGDPHAEAAVVAAGTPLEGAPAAVILLHGRGGTARDILTLAEAVDRPAVAWLAPQAAGQSWYPNSFLAPLAENEPWLSSALAVVTRLLAEAVERGVEARRVVLAGFSQGGCLALEYATRHARRYGGLAGLSSGVIGPPGAPRAYEGTLEGTPVFLGCSDRDPHVPLDRVVETAEVMSRLGGEVTTRIYEAMGHTVNHEEIGHLRSIVDLAAGAPAQREER